MYVCQAISTDFVLRNALNCCCVVTVLLRQYCLTNNKDWYQRAVVCRIVVRAFHKYANIKHSVHFNRITSRCWNWLLLLISDCLQGRRTIKVTPPLTESCTSKIGMYITIRSQWLAFCRRNFAIYFPVWKTIFFWHVTETCKNTSAFCQILISQKRLQANALVSDGIINSRIYASLAILYVCARRWCICKIRQIGINSECKMTLLVLPLKYPPSNL